MSGGYFDYQQYRIYDIVISIQELIDNNVPGKDEYGYERIVYSPQTIEEFKKGIDVLKLAEVYAQRVDWLVCGDDNEESFHARLTEDIKAVDSDI
jgi:hypothetical protein